MHSPKFIKVNHDAEITNPFDGDLWDRKALADRLEQFIEPLNIGMTIALDAEWGVGKTWFVKNWIKQLKDHGFKVLYLDAFAQDYVDDPFISISMEIAKCLEDEKGGTEKFVEHIGDIYRAALPSFPMILWTITTTLVGAGALAKPFSDIIERLQEGSGEAGKEIGNLIDDQLKAHLSAQVENYENEKNSLQYFKDELIHLTKDLDKPLVFVIDELDRCKPEFAIRLIERIKHFFDVPNIVFVLSVNKKQLEQSINSSYGFSEDANYLEKFIDITVHLKNKELDEEKYKNILDEYGKKLGIQQWESGYLLACMIYKPNARQLIKILNRYSFLKINQNSGGCMILFIVLIFQELRLISPFNQSNFVRYFHDSHFSVLSNYYEAQRLRYAPSQYNYTFYEFLSDRYKHLGGFLKYFSNSAGQKNSDVLISYFPNEISSADLIESWDYYIHVIGN
ncbi:KAP family NTPase [Acinetobacter sp. C32I]|uniref:KAP family P-loop NTPase fold protein n=1 Tax=Acinetobacter sp. C32I TaxID=2950074 RepID=UPI002036B689|nr:P-loop NTPase fold protein [Acinetobacter sp. C32I]USA53203.1 KAP family NTPase [Acinetobacter sp. C32I]